MTQNVIPAPNNPLRPRSQTQNTDTSGLTPINTDTINRCIQVTESFRIGDLTKAEAFLGLQTILCAKGYDEAVVVKALDDYIGMLNNYDQHRRAAAAQGRSQNNPLLGQVAHGGIESDQPSAQVTPDQPVQESATIGIQPSSDEIEEETRRQTKRPRSPASDDENEPSSRPKIDLKALPWVQKDELDPPTLSCDLRETLQILDNIARDPKVAKISLVNSARCPEFPSSEWDNILAGRSINLDHVLASGYAVTHDEKRTERIGDLELVLGPSKPARSVDTHGKWVIAWERASDALVYVFPHCCNELRDYGSYIKRLFAAFPESYHS
jgi:hypothetical protein